MRGVGPRLAGRLATLGLHSVGDLLFHLPLRYQDRTRVRPLGELHAGDEGVIAGEIETARRGFGRRRSLVVVVGDGTGRIALRFFHFSESQRRGLCQGRRISCFGEVREGGGGLEMVHPEYRLLQPGEAVRLDTALTPVYPGAAGLGQPLLRRLAARALALLDGDASLDEALPESLRTRLALCTLREALLELHQPSPRGGAPDATRCAPRRRLAFEELLAHQLSQRLLRHRMDEHQAPRLDAPGRVRARFLEKLAFSPTGAQRRVSDEILRDLARERPMHRLLQGDVGSGKTLVAALAALQAIESGRQVALVAPTELLGEQHLTRFRAWLGPLGLECGWLSGRLPAAERRAVLDAAASGALPMLVGTHALFQDEIAFARLGLVIVDEQHRFGVHQRLALREKGAREGLRPHQLTMTATPIPRTLAMSACADLDTSVIDELPPGRGPIETAVLPHTRREDLVRRVHRACREGRQAYWVCTLIDESETLCAQNAAETAARLARAMPDLRVGLVHGRMKRAERDGIMDEFRAGGVRLLVATTVIEVGVDVPNASLMIIENAERLGLSQLHQLRGRVGRGRHRSVCLMLYAVPLSKNARERLDVLRETTDGFTVSERDLELRGPGELLGTRQTGLRQMRVADLLRDRELLPAVRRAAAQVFSEHPECVPVLLHRWIDGALDYGQV